MPLPSSLAMCFLPSLQHFSPSPCSLGLCLCLLPCLTLCTLPCLYVLCAFSCHTCYSLHLPLPPSLLMALPASASHSSQYALLENFYHLLSLKYGATPATRGVHTRSRGCAGVRHAPRVKLALPCLPAWTYKHLDATSLLFTCGTMSMALHHHDAAAERLRNMYRQA